MSYSSENIDSELILSLKEGSRDAFRQIFDYYQGKLFFYTKAIVKSNSVAKDIAQETLIQLWVTRANLDPHLSLSGYIHTIARNLALNHLKRAGYDDDLRNKIWATIQEKQTATLQEDQIFEMENYKFVKMAIDQLPPKRRQIFKLSHEEGFTHKEIAEYLNISPNTVKNQMVSALKDIRSYLKGHTDIALSWFILALLHFLK